MPPATTRVGAGLPAQEGRQGGPYAGEQDTSQGTNLPTFQEVVSSVAQSLANLPTAPPPVARLRVALTDLAIDSVDSLLVTFNRVDVKFTPDGATEGHIVTIWPPSSPSPSASSPSPEPAKGATGEGQGGGELKLSFTAELRKTGELTNTLPGEHSFFAWNLAFSSFKKALLVREFSETKELTGTITEATPDPIPFPVTINFDGRDKSTDGDILPDGLYIYVVNAAAYLTTDPKQPPDNGKGGNGQPKNSPSPSTGQGSPNSPSPLTGEVADPPTGASGGEGATTQADTRVLDRDKFFGSARIDNTLPALAFTKPGSRFIFSHDRVQAELFAKDPLAGEDSNSGLDPDTFKASITNGEFPATNPKEIANLLAPSLSGYATEPFTSRGPDLLVEFTRSGLLTETGPCRATMADGTRSAMDGCGGCNCVREGVNILRATLEDNAENERNATGLKFLVDRVKPEGGWETPPFALVPANGDPLITNTATATFQVRFTDPMPKGLNTASGLREDTARILFQNRNTGYSLDRRLGDGLNPAFESNPVEFTNPFGEAIAGDVVPLTTRLKIAGLSLPDGNYTATAFLADRATDSGDAYSANQPPVNVGEAKVEFCLDRTLPGVAGFDLSSPVASSSTDPSFIPSAVPNVTIQCADPSPSCGLKTLTLVAIRTHAPAPFPSGGPIDIPDETNNINLVRPHSLCPRWLLKKGNSFGPSILRSPRLIRAQVMAHRA